MVELSKKASGPGIESPARSLKIMPIKHSRQPSPQSIMPPETSESSHHSALHALLYKAHVFMITHGAVLCGENPQCEGCPLRSCCEYGSLLREEASNPAPLAMRPPPAILATTSLPTSASLAVNTAMITTDHPVSSTGCATADKPDTPAVAQLATASAAAQRSGTISYSALPIAPLQGFNAQVAAGVPAVAATATPPPAVAAAAAETTQQSAEKSTASQHAERRNPESKYQHESGGHYQLIYAREVLFSEGVGNSQPACMCAGGDL